MLDRALGEAVLAGDVGYPFAQIEGILSIADMTIGNLESALGDLGTPEKKGYTFRAPKETVETLSLAGFDLLSLANNHAMDYGAEGLIQAIMASSSPSWLTWTCPSNFGALTLGPGSLARIAPESPGPSPCASTPMSPLPSHKPTS